MKLHATTFSGAEYIQMLEPAQASFRIITWPNDKSQMSLGFLEAALGRRYFSCCLFLFLEKKNVIFKHLDQKTKCRILFPLPITLQYQEFKTDHYVYKRKGFEMLLFFRFYITVSPPALRLGLLRWVMEKDSTARIIVVSIYNSLPGKKIHGVFYFRHESKPILLWYKLWT